MCQCTDIQDATMYHKATKLKNGLLLHLMILACLPYSKCQVIPTNPCPQLFQYQQNNNRFYGQITVPQDYSGSFNLMVNVSLAAYIQNANIQLDLETSVQDLMNGQNPLYRVNFPLQDVLPKLTQIVFNNNVLCYGPPEPLIPGSGITNFWAENNLRITNSNGFQQPVQRPFQQPSQQPIQQPIQRPIHRPTKYPLHPPAQRPIHQHVQYPIHPPAQRPIEQPPKRPVKYPICLTCTQKTVREVPHIAMSEPVTFTVPFPDSMARPDDYYQGSPTTEFVQYNSPRNPFTSSPIEDRNAVEERCGLQNEHLTLIYRGSAVQEGEYPWLVALFYYEKPMKYTFQCTCNLISERHVITAGHCIQYGKVLLNDKDNIILVIGKHNLDNWVAGAEIRNVKTISVHPDYAQDSGGNDIAIFTLSTPVSFQANIKPVCLWSGDSALSPVVENGGTVVGWGESMSGELFSHQPHKIEMPVVSQEECLRSHSGFLKLTSEDTFCGGAKNSSGPCRGDSGAGFVMKINDRYFLRGLVSYSLYSAATGCDLNNFIVFVDVAKKMNWITTILNST